LGVGGQKAGNVARAFAGRAMAGGTAGLIVGFGGVRLLALLGIFHQFGGSEGIAKWGVLPLLSRSYAERGEDSCGECDGAGSKERLQEVPPVTEKQELSTQSQ